MWCLMISQLAAPATRAAVTPTSSTATRPTLAAGRPDQGEPSLRRVDRRRTSRRTR